MQDRTKARFLPLILLAAALLFYTTTLPTISLARTISKSFAVSAVVLLSLSLAIGALARSWHKAVPAVPYRKFWGLVGVAFALLHAGIAFSDPLIFSVSLALSRQNVQLGLVALIIFAFLAVTSNRWAEKRLGFKYWKRLQQLGYLALAFVGLDLLVLGSGTFVRTPLGLLLGGIVAATLGLAAWDVWKNKKRSRKTGPENVSRK
ncbi:ferric reductase-like transmembrane domain-containing protein [Candidatus Micrarchaeota archaeon]|nr:ferric reductase-like transmembrane domain-containing protein [Candidatus Micrarchaeota archaeon]